MTTSSRLKLTTVVCLLALWLLVETEKYFVIGRPSLTLGVI